MSDDRILFVDDDGEYLSSLTRALKSHGLDLSFSALTSADKGLEYAQANSPAVAIIDLSLDPVVGVDSGFKLLSDLLELDPTCRVIVLTGHGGVEHGVRALTLGAASFLEKPAELKHLLALINDGISQARLQRAHLQLVANRSTEALSEFCGISNAAREVQDSIQFAAASNQSVLISGETGTGKGLCAKLIHRLSARSHGNFVRYQPSFGTSDLINSDLFGHIKGSFTGAEFNRRGLLAEAKGGTLFLDEIDELPNEIQVALLGVLQDKVYRAVGSNKEEATDFRLITATNQAVDRCLEEGKLRADFYHRVAHLTIVVPALRTRTEDITVLAEFLLKAVREREGLSVWQISQEAIPRLLSYDWPGNVRELQAAVEGAAFRAQYRGAAEISEVDLVLRSSNSPITPVTFHEKVANLKFQLVQEAMSSSGGNQVKAALALGIDRASLRRILFKQ